MTGGPPHALPSRDRACSVARTVEILSDAWMFLVLRESFFGARRFEQFQHVLKLPRNTLIVRLRKLTNLGLMHKVGYSSSASRYDYRLTEMGRDLYPTMLSLLRFGDDWLGQGAPLPLQLIHRGCGARCSPVVVCSACDQPVGARDVDYRPGSGAGEDARDALRKRSRRASDPSILERVRPCSVARSLQIIGDRWTFLLIRELFFGVRRFDEFAANMGIASNILTDRLQRLAAHGIIGKHAYQSRPERFEYRFTERGLDLYGPMIVMMRWGDRWLSGGKPPLLLRHKPCGKDFFARVVCSACREELDPKEMQYELRYSLVTTEDV